MKKQLAIIGIIALLLCVGLSGCTNNEINNRYENRTGTPLLLQSNIVLGFGLASDNFLTAVNQSNGTVWVNFSFMNLGSRGGVTAYAHVYQGIGNYSYCGNGTIYNQTQSHKYSIENDEKVFVSFVFTGVNCATGSGCYGSRYWID
jgi:hypothetical protein